MEFPAGLIANTVTQIQDTQRLRFSKLRDPIPVAQQLCFGFLKKSEPTKPNKAKPSQTIRSRVPSRPHQMVSGQVACSSTSMQRTRRQGGLRQLQSVNLMVWIVLDSDLKPRTKARKSALQTWEADLQGNPKEATPKWGSAFSEKKRRSEVRRCDTLAWGTLLVQSRMTGLANARRHRSQSDVHHFEAVKLHQIGTVPGENRKNKHRRGRTSGCTGKEGYGGGAIPGFQVPPEGP